MKNYKLFTATILIASIIMQSCLKDDAFDDGTIQSVNSQGNDPKVIELKVAANDNTNFVSIAIDNSTNDTTINFIPVQLATAGNATEDIQVTVALDTNLVNEYNLVHESQYINLGEALFEIVNPVVTIPKGSKTGFLQLRIKPSDIVGQSVAFGFKIASIAQTGYTISGNFSTAVASLVIKNQYDGIYEAAGYFDHPVFFGDFVNTWDAVTTGAYTVEMPLYTTVNFTSHFFLTVDPVTNLVEITSNDLPIDPYVEADNYYDPATRSYHLDFGYTTSAPRHLTCVATYTGPR